MDVGIFGYYRDAGAVYVPSLAEWALGIGVIAAAGLVFLALVENFSIFDDRWRVRRAADAAFDALFDTFTRVWNRALRSGLSRISLILAAVLPLAWVAMYPPFTRTASGGDPVRAPIALDTSRKVLRLDGNRGGVFTDFPHADHQERLGGDDSCVTCHHVSLPGDRSSACSRCHRDMFQFTDIFAHRAHMEAVAARENLCGPGAINGSCAFCHDAELPHSKDSAKACFDCHKDDMWLAGRPDPDLDLARARSYSEAMHQVCVDCHEQEGKKAGRADLGDCSTCHESLRTKEKLVASRKGPPPPALPASEE